LVLRIAVTNSVLVVHSIYVHFLRNFLLVHAPLMVAITSFKRCYRIAAEIVGERCTPAIIESDSRQEEEKVKG
jgi:hypothetical protein